MLKGFCKKHKTSELIAFLANGTILCPMKTPENQTFSVGFSRYKIGLLAKHLSTFKTLSIVLKNKHLNHFQCCHYIETNQLISNANQLIGFLIMTPFIGCCSDEFIINFGYIKMLLSFLILSPPTYSLSHRLGIFNKTSLFHLKCIIFFCDSLFDSLLAILCFNSFSSVRHNSNVMLHRPSKRECEKPISILRLGILYRLGSNGNLFRNWFSQFIAQMLTATKSKPHTGTRSA